MAGAVTVRSVLARLGWEVDTTGLDRWRRKTDDAKRGMEGLEGGASKARRALGSIFDGLAKFDLASNAIGKLAAPLHALVATGARFEALRSSLTTIEGSAAAAADTFGRLQKFAAETPFQLEELVSSYNKLKAQGIDPSERALRAYGDTAAAMGKSFGDMAEAVTDAASGEFERLKEFGIKASKQGDQVTFTFKGVKKTVAFEAGEIQRYLVELGETNFAGGMERQSKTLEGLWSTLQDGLAAVADETMRAGLGDMLKEYVRDGIAAAEAAGKWVVQNRELIKTKIDAFLGGLRDTAKSLWPILEFGVKVVAGLASVLSKMGGAGGVGPAIAGLTALRVATMAALGPWGLLAAAGVAAGVAIANSMADAERRTLSLGRSVGRMVDKAKFDQGLEGKSASELVKMRDDLARERKDRRFIREDVRGLSPKEIKRLERERQLDDETTARKQAALEEAIAKVSAQENDDIKRRLDEARQIRDDAHAKQDAESQGIADREELRYLRRKGRLSPEERGRKMELEAQLKKDRKDRLKSGDLAGAGLDDEALAKSKKPKKTKEEKTLMDLITGSEPGEHRTRSQGLGTTIVNIDARIDSKVEVVAPTGLVAADAPRAARIAADTGDAIARALEPYLERQIAGIRKAVEG